MNYFCQHRANFMDVHLNFIKTYLDIDQVYNIENKTPQHESKKYSIEKINKLQRCVCEIICEVSKIARIDINKWTDISKKL